MSASQEAIQQTPPDANEVDMMDSSPESPPESSHASFSNPQNQGSSSRANINYNTNSRGDGNTGDKLASGTPGASWNNKKFKEEYENAQSRLIHQDYDPSRYGDPLMN